MTAEKIPPTGGRVKCLSESRGYFAATLLLALGILLPPPELPRRRLTSDLVCGEFRPNCAFDPNEMAIAGMMPAIQAPTLGSVTTASGTTVRVQWSWADNGFFSQYVVQQWDASNVWHDLATIAQQATTGGLAESEGTGAPFAWDATLPFRVVVHDTSSQSAASNEVTITVTALAARQLLTVASVPPDKARLTWSWTGAVTFDHFAVQEKNQMNQWVDLATITDRGATQWTGAPLPGAFVALFRIVVVSGQATAISNEMGIVRG